MPGRTQTTFVLASDDPNLLARIEPALAANGAQVQVVLSAEAALEAMSGKAPSLALLDAVLPGMPIGQLLAAVRADGTSRAPIVVFSDTVSEEFKDRLKEGIIDDIFPRDIALDYLHLRAEMALRARECAEELDTLRSEVIQNAQYDRLTGTYNRDAMLAQLFRETDRVQRMSTSLCVILFDIDDFGHWNMRLGNQACDELLRQAVKRVNRLLRSYDILGRAGKDEFLAALPGCSAVNAVLLTERIRSEVFGAPFHVAGRAVRLSACFGVAPSKGRSPVVVLREAEEALRMAKESGPESIQCSSDCPRAAEAPFGFLSAGAAEEEAEAW